MSDWSENTVAAPVDQTGYETPAQFIPTEPDATDYDDINMYADITNSLTGGGGSDVGDAIAGSLEQQMAGRYGVGQDPASGTGGPPADKTPSGLDSMLASFKKFIGWDEMSEERKTNTQTIGAGIVKGIGDSYFASRKLANEEKKLSTDTMLAETQANLAKQRMANQAGPLTFNAPKGLIGGQIAKITPFQNRIPR